MSEEQYYGFVFFFNEGERSEALLQKVKADGKFTDTISYSDLKPSRFEVCFHSFDGSFIDYVSLFRLGSAVVTAKNRVLFSNFQRFEPISFDVIQKETNIDFKAISIKSSSGLGKRVSSNVWTSLLASIQKLNRDAYSKYEKLVQIRSDLSASFSQSGVDIIAQEKDATGLALEIFGLDREEVLFSWAPVEGRKYAPYITGFKQKTYEDPMIVRDTMVFGDWASNIPDMQGSVEFYKEGKQLTIRNFNRQKVENTTGVDLVYYNHEFNSYVLVQYKKMQLEKEKQGKNVRNIIVYRPVDESYKAEIERMRKLENMYDTHLDLNDIQSYRMHSNPFYFKLCLPFHLELGSAELIKGMYFPLDYWEQLLQSKNVRGKRGGLRIVYQDSARHINNTLFIELLQHGWIGSRLYQTEGLTRIIMESLEQNRVVQLAISNDIG